MPRQIYINQILIIAAAAALLIAAGLFDVWQAQLMDAFSTSFENRHIGTRIWSLPMMAALLAVCGLGLSFYNRRRGAWITSLIIGCLGLAVLFYPSFAVTFHLLRFFGISVDYFGDTLFYTAALILAVGITGLTKPRETNPVSDPT